MMAALNDWGDAWLRWFGPLVLQNTFFLALVFLALHALRHASARVRAAVAAVGVLKLVLPPFLVIAAGRQDAVAADVPAGVSTLLFPFSDEVADAAAGPIWSGGLSLVAAAMLAWAGIACARLGRIVLPTLRLARAVRGASAVPAGDLPADVRRAGIAIKRAPRIAVPLSIGPWPRAVYVPPAWDGWSPANRAAILRHELAHVRRRDGLVLGLEILVEALYFFHPLVHRLIRRARLWREMACDDVSVSADPGARLGYLRFLTELADTALGQASATETATTLLQGGSDLKHRVTHQIKEGLMAPVSRIRIVLVAALLLVAVVPLSLVLADPAPPAPPARSAPNATPAPKADPPAEPAPVATPAPEALVEPGAEPPADAPPAPPASALRVVIRDAGITVDGEPVSMEEFSDLVRKHVQIEDEKAVVTIDGAGDVPMATLHKVQQMLHALDLDRVVYTGEIGRKLPLVLPPEKAKQNLAKLPAEDKVAVKVDAAGVLTVDGRKVAGADLPALVAKRVAERPTVVFILKTEPQTRYGAFVQVLDGLKQGGAERIAVEDPGR